MATNPITSDSLTIDFKQLMKIPVGNRVQAASLSGSFLQSLINSLTPIQIAKAFPDYYRRSLPDISNFINASRYFDAGGKAHQTGGGELGYTPDYYDEETKPGGVPRGSELTLEQMKQKLLEKGINVDNTYDLLAQGPVLAGDERLQFIKNFSTDKLLEMGIEKYQDENGKDLFKLRPVSAEGMTDEQIQVEMKKEAASKEGTYRPAYPLSDIDLSPEVINTIAGEALNNKESIDGVINNMLNRVGAQKDWTNLKDVARAPGQYAGYRVASEEQAEIIKARIKEITSGKVPSNIGAATEFRAEYYVKGEGYGKTFEREARKQGYLQPSPGDNVYAETFAAGPYAPRKAEEVEKIKSENAAKVNKSYTLEEIKIYKEELIKKQRQELKDKAVKELYELPSPTSSDYIQLPFEKQNVTVLHGQSDTFMTRSSPGVLAAGIENIDPRLVTLGDAAIRSFEMMNPGYTVRVISGKRTEATNSGSPTSRHLRGGAVDYEIVDPDGNVLPNLGGGKSGIRAEAGFSAPKYEELGRYMEAARVNLAKDDPRYAEDQVVSGLHFGGDWWMDSMHMQLGGKGALGDLYSGFKSPEQLRQEGQPEVIVQAVENAIKAGAVNSMNKDEMEQLSEYLYNGGTAPVEVIQKVNPVVAEKLQKELEQKEIETAKKLEEEKATAAVQIQATPETSAQSVVPEVPVTNQSVEPNKPTAIPEVPVTNQSVEPNKPTAIPVKEQTASAAVPNNPVPQFALGGNMRGLNEDMTLVETETGKPIAQMGQNEKIEKQGNAIQVTPETKLKADELTEKYDASSEVETRMNNIEERIDQQQETSSQSARRPPVPEPIDNAPPNKWKEAVAAAERPVSPSFNRAIARAKFFPEGHHYQRGAVSSKST